MDHPTGIGNLPRGLRADGTGPQIAPGRCAAAADDNLKGLEGLTGVGGGDEPMDRSPGEGGAPRPRRRPRHRHRAELHQRGMVTAELAVGLLTAGIVMVVAVFVVQLVVTQSRCADTAAAVARQLARGDRQAADAARQSAPRGASTDIGTATIDGTHEVVVTVRLDESLGRLGPVHLVGRAIAAVEPGVNP